MSKRHKNPAVPLRVLEPDIQSLEQLYSFRRQPEILQFLETHPFLVPLLAEAHSKIGDYFGPSPQVILEVVTDPEAKSLTKMFGYIVSGLIPEEAGRRLQRLDRDWFLKQLPRVKGLLNFDVEFV
ncbi:MAG: hypothetical protein ACE5MB_03525 [Anaerolineae bacterium]